MVMMPISGLPANRCNLKAMPTLYLLDAEKRVILKDASFEQVEERLS